MPIQHLSPRLLQGGRLEDFVALTLLAVMMLVALGSWNVEYSANAKISTVMAMAKHSREWHPLIIVSVLQMLSPIDFLCKYVSANIVSHQKVHVKPNLGQESLAGTVAPRKGLKATGALIFLVFR